MITRNNENRKSVNSQSVCNTSNQSCSFIYQLPDVVLQRKHDRKMPYAETFNGIILFADVSGFTEMCQKYSADVQRGVNQLANALNGYMSPIVEAILQEKGDVYKFAGDAVLGNNYLIKLRHVKREKIFRQVCGHLKMILWNINVNKRKELSLVLCI